MQFDRTLTAPYGEDVRLSLGVSRLLAPNPGPFTFKGTGVYIVGGGSGVAVIDPGPDDPVHLAALKRAIGSRTVSHILITHTHRDHSPAAAPLKAWSGAHTYGFGPHAAATGEVEEGGDHDFIPDVVLRDGDRIAGDGFILEAVHTPGHTSNHLCYAFREEQALFSGDHVMGWSTSVIAPPDGDMGDYLASLEKLAARDDRILYPTHGSPIAEPKAWLRALIVHRRMREGQILAALPATVPALVASLYSELEASLRAAAAAQVVAHLSKLEGEGRAALQDGRWIRIPRP